ncbi:MAG: hypothetical protein Ta2A_05500 [Treponemataceae bacterium]|nr:MAG: hypothetical protein Ta2A_05500 [Treponemataceae bacterium]
MTHITQIRKHNSRIAFAAFVAFFAVVPMRVDAQEAAGGRYALVIGNQEYQKIQPLLNPVNDARDIAAALKKLGYAIDEPHLNLTRHGMLDAVDAFIAQLAENPQNEGFFWYAGHGVQIRGENYLLPVDVSVESESRVASDAYPLNSLLDRFSEADNKVNVVIIDACRNNPLPSTSRGNNTRGLAVVSAVPQDLVVMYSTAAGSTAEDGAPGTRNSPFAQAFLQNIANAEPLALVLADVTQTTFRLTESRQRPFQAGSIMNKNYSLKEIAAGTDASVAVSSQSPTRLASGNTAAKVAELFSTAQAHAASGEYILAIANYTEALKLDADNVAALERRAWSYTFNAQDAEAAADWNHLLRLNPDAVSYWHGLAGLYTGIDDAKAVSAYSQAIKRLPKEDSLWYARAFAYSRMGEAAPAAADMDEVIRLNPSAANYCARAEIFAHGGSAEKAVADYTAAIKVSDNSYDRSAAYQYRGEIYDSLQNYDDAITDYTAAIGARADAEYFLFELRGKAYIAKRDWARAISDYTKAIALYPQNENAYFYRAYAHQYSKDYAAAVADYTKALEIDPDYEAAKNNLAAVAAAMKRSQ